MRWRYQPVWLADSLGIRFYSLCECFFDDADALVAWTEDPAMMPKGETARGLRRDLARMLSEAWKWEPVDFATLHAGMTFERTGVDVDDALGAMLRAIEPREREP